jgi:hypothetical protein
MERVMKKTIVVLGIIIVFLVVFLLSKDLIVKTAVTQGIKAITGVTLEVESIKVGIFKQVVAIKNLKLFNPPGYADKLMADIPEIYVDYDLAAFFKGQVHLREIRLNLKEMAVDKNNQGKVNLESLQALQPKGQGKMPQFKIDLLKLDIGKVLYRNYSVKGKPQIKEFNLNIHERYENITEPYSLVAVIISRALVNTTIAQLIKFEGPLKDAINNTVDKAAKVIKGAAGLTLDSVGKATGALKDIFSGSSK